MLSNKDINFDDERQILAINGEAHAVGDPAIPGEIEALDERVTALEGIPAQVEALDGRVTALEEAGGGVSDWVQIGETSSIIATTGTVSAMMHKSNIANYSEFMFIAYCEDGTVAVPPPIQLIKKLVQRVIDNSNSFSVTNGTLNLTIEPQDSFPVNHVNVKLTEITTTDKRYFIEFYGRPV